jgi:hypothetical protein
MKLCVDCQHYRPGYNIDPVTGMAFDWQFCDRPRDADEKTYSAPAERTGDSGCGSTGRFWVALQKASQP